MSTDINERDVELVSADASRNATLRWSDRRRASGGYLIELVGPGEPIVGTGTDLFEALIVLRNTLHAQGWRIAVQGARRDTWATGMIRNMVGAERVYVLEFGRPMDRRHLVPIFAPADPADIGTPADQKANYFAWRESVQGRGKAAPAPP